MIRDHVVCYSLKKDEYDKCSSYDITRIANLAKQRFISRDRSGELGELILFALLEHKRKAPQIINKMALKTDGNMPIFGIDAIHLGIFNDELRQYFGESKIYADCNEAIINAVKSIDKYNKDILDEEFELELISSNMDKSKFSEYSDEIFKIFHPYKKHTLNIEIRRVYSIFIGYNWDSIETIDWDSIISNIEITLKDSLESQSNKILKKCKDKVSSSSINTIVEFYFIPFKNVDDTRRKFKDLIS